MNYKDVNDNELLFMIKENDEYAKEIVLDKYKYIIDILMKKYSNMAWTLGIDKNDLYQESLIGFFDAINNYRDDKNASLATFITLCVERKIKSYLKSANRLKNKIMFESLSLEHTYEQFKQPLMYVLSDESENDPLTNIEADESAEELLEQAKEVLSDNENEVLSLMIHGLDYIEIATLLDKNPKQIDNTRNRIRTKIRKIL